MALAQTIKPQKLQKLPPEISESSGLVFLNDSILISHNDGGNNATIFLLKWKQPMVQINFPEFRNHDWEEACMMNNQLLIGDFGNNCNCRHNLSVLRFDTVHVNSEISFIPDGRCAFSFSDQTEFPPSESNFNFDCEAMTTVAVKLFLFSKNNSDHGSGFTKMYLLDEQKDSSMAMLTDSFYLNAPITAACNITGTDTVLLMSYFGLYVGTIDTENQFQLFGTLGWNRLTQKEAICYSDEGIIFLTDEKHFNGGNLYALPWQLVKSKLSYCKVIDQHLSLHQKLMRMKYHLVINLASL